MKTLCIRVAVIAAFLVLVGMSGVPALRAQDASDWLRVNVVNVVPERLEDYIELQLTEVTPGLQEAGVPWRSVWRTAEFGNSYELQFVQPVGDLADYDAGGPLARVMQPDRLQRLIDRLRRYTVSRQSYAVRYRAELSVESDDVASLFVARVSTLEVAPGRVGEWTAFLERNLTQFRGAGVVFGVYQRMLGPAPTAWQLVENHESFAELAQPSIIVRAFGEQADSVASELAGVVLSVQRSVLRYDPELSYSSIPSP